MGKLINIDNGGTQTDFCVLDGERLHYTKTLTTPHDLSSCFFEGLTRIAEQCFGEADVARLLQDTDYIRYSTTQGTNALVERKGPRLGLIVDRQDELDALCRDGAARAVFAALVGERVGRIDTRAAPEALDAAVTAAVNALTAAGANRLVVSIAGADFEAAERAIERIVLRRYPSQLLGAVPVSFAGELARDADPGRRLFTALFNSFLHPAMERFLYSADHRLKRHRTRNPLLIFRNDGGSARVAKTIALKTYSSGPRGGMEGALALAEHYRLGEVVTCDIGGTTTDVGWIRDGRVPQTTRGLVEDVPISFPLCQLHSEGVGGSSVVRAVDGKIVVGPDSVGAVPGPACFGRGGSAATMTDAALLGGIIAADSYFGGELELDAARAAKAVHDEVAGPLGLNLDAALAAIEAAWVAKVVAGIHRVGRPGPATTLLAFGGAGAFVATRIAAALGLRELLIPGLSAVFSAFGIGFSDLSQHYQTSLAARDVGAVTAAWQDMVVRARRDMFAEGTALEECAVSGQLVTLAQGAEAATAWQPGAALPAALADAEEATLHLKVLKAIRRIPLSPLARPPASAAPARGTRLVLIDGRRMEVPLYRLEDLAPGASGVGPAIVEESYFTGRIDAGWRYALSSNRDLRLIRE
ncbi:MAG TPA: hydantoinase/oxoprolinase family protein [Gammaproteobacteria bacterium]|nr:hydantoinase/oxoprolinase family protein [Gammaproteobacteria bacterium]